MKTKGFTFLRWNGEYGKKAVFVVKDNKTNKQTLFTPERLEDIAWTDRNLADDYKNWEEFGNETVDNLEDVAF